MKTIYEFKNRKLFKNRKFNEKNKKLKNKLNKFHFSKRENHQLLEY